MQTAPGSAECTACYECADRCPAQTISTRWRLPWRQDRHAVTEAGRRTVTMG